MTGKLGPKMFPSSKIQRVAFSHFLMLIYHSSGTISKTLNKIKCWFWARKLPINPIFNTKSIFFKNLKQSLSPTYWVGVLFYRGYKKKAEVGLKIEYVCRREFKEAVSIAKISGSSKMVAGNFLDKYVQQSMQGSDWYFSNLFLILYQKKFILFFLCSWTRFYARLMPLWETWQDKNEK